MKTESKPTPGPWKAYHDKNHYSGVDDLYQIHWSNDGECVAEIVHGEANARLIAAAPELLEALERVLEYVPAIVSDELSEVLIEAEAVIAKVKE